MAYEREQISRSQTNTKASSIASDTIIQTKPAPEVDSSELTMPSYTPLPDDWDASQHFLLRNRANVNSDVVQAKMSNDGGSMTTQPDTATMSVVPPNQTGMPDLLKAGLEQMSGMDLSEVRVHRNSSKPTQLQALAYTQGTDIHVAPGQEKHLPHEGWHVVQQMAGRVKPTMQMVGVAINDERGLEREADVMGEKALSLSFSSSNTVALQKPLKENSSVGGSGNAPVQGRFGFEIEIPVLFLDKADLDIPSAAGGPDIRMNNVPRDAAKRVGETDVYDGTECHVNVDHSRTLDPLFKSELIQYGIDNGHTPNEQNSLLAAQKTLMPFSASIVEVVTDAWDENTLTRIEAQRKIQAVIDWIRTNCFDPIAGNRQAALGAYFIGSNSPNSDLFQPRLGYFHSTYGVKLSQVPRLFKETTRQKKNLRNYARINRPEQEHANNVRKTQRSIGTAKTAMKAIKRVWPRTGAGFFNKGTKEWNNGTEQTFLGFITLLTNYLLMFQGNNNGNLAKQMVGMHYYKSDLYDIAQRLPNEIINTLRGNSTLRTQTVAAIGASVGLAVDAPLGGPMGDKTLTEYLLQIFTGDAGPIIVDPYNPHPDEIRDPLLAYSINPYSRKLGPDLLGPAGNREYGVVMENRHLEYIDPNYGTNQDRSEAQMRQDVDLYGPPKAGADTRTTDEKAMYDSIGAREAGPAKRPIDEWEDMMMYIYDMIRGINSR